jgi:hypothetical protein
MRILWLAWAPALVACAASAPPGPTVPAPPPSASPPATTTRPAWPWPALDRPAHVAAEGGDDAAVIVGIENYSHVTGIPGATKNAADWYRFFVEDRKIPVERVKLVTNAEGDREHILDAVKKAAAAARPEGTLWFVYIGHGAPLDEAGAVEGVLVGEDTKQNAVSLSARSVKQRELESAMVASRARRRIAVLDACFSGRTPDGGTVVPGLQPLLVMKDGAAGGSVTWLTAATSAQFAGPLPGAARPAFSYLLLGALRGWAADAEGAVTAKAALAWTQKALAVLEPKLGRSQTPELAGPLPDRALVSGARETGPDLAAMMASSALASVGERPGQPRAGFGEGLGTLSEIPTVRTLPEGLTGAGSLRDADVDLLKALESAKRAEKDGAVAANDKAGAWAAFARVAQERGSVLQQQAEARRDQWLAVARAEERRDQQLRAVCKQHREDARKLRQLTELDEDVVSTKLKVAYQSEFEQTYAAWYAELSRCERLGERSCPEGDLLESGRGCVSLAREQAERVKRDAERAKRKRERDHEEEAERVRLAEEAARRTEQANAWLRAAGEAEQKRVRGWALLGGAAIAGGVAGGLAYLWQHALGKVNGGELATARDIDGAIRDASAGRVGTIVFAAAGGTFLLASSAILLANLPPTKPAGVSLRLTIAPSAVGLGMNF